MLELKPKPPEPFHLLAQRVVERAKRTSEVSPKTIARDLKVSHQTVLRWLRNDKYHIPAEKLPELCTILDDFTLLDELEERAGRIAFPKPNIEEPLPADDVIAVQRLVREVGAALQCLAETLEDHIVEDWEVERTVPVLKDVIRECVRLQYWLRKRSIADSKKIESKGERS
jgi:hypothetical protein